MPTSQPLASLMFFGTGMNLIALMSESNLAKPRLLCPSVLVTASKPSMCANNSQSLQWISLHHVCLPGRHVSAQDHALDPASICEHLFPLPITNEFALWLYPIVLTLETPPPPCPEQSPHASSFAMPQWLRDSGRVLQIPMSELLAKLLAHFMTKHLLGMQMQPFLPDWMPAYHWCLLAASFLRRLHHW